MAKLKPVKLRKLDDLVVTVTVQVTRELRFRVWLAIKLIQLAVWVIGGRTAINLQSNVEREQTAQRPTLH